jgi:predicted nucleotidyltransferase
MNKNQALNLAKSYLEKLKKTRIPIQQSFIFGSFVKKRFTKNSDIDLAIVSPAFGKDKQKERILLMNLRDEKTLIIEPHPISLKEWQLKLNPIINEIKKNAIMVSV